MIPNDMGYSLKLYLSSGRTTIVYMSLYENDHANIYLQNNFFAYSNDKLLSYIDTLYSHHPTVLSLNTAQNKSISLTNASLLSSLWPLPI